MSAVTLDMVDYTGGGHPVPARPWRVFGYQHGQLFALNRLYDESGAREMVEFFKGLGLVFWTTPADRHVWRFGHWMPVIEDVAEAAAS